MGVADSRVEQVASESTMLSILLRYSAAHGHGLLGLIKKLLRTTVLIGHPLKGHSWGVTNNHDCVGNVCAPLYGDSKMDCVPKYIAEPDCSIFASLPVSSNGRSLSNDKSVSKNK